MVSPSFDLHLRIVQTRWLKRSLCGVLYTMLNRHSTSHISSYIVSVCSAVLIDVTRQSGLLWPIKNPLISKYYTKNIHRNVNVIMRVRTTRSSISTHAFTQRKSHFCGLNASVSIRFERLIIIITPWQRAQSNRAERWSELQECICVRTSVT